MLGANALLGGTPSAEEVMGLAVGQEGHLDNIAAALHGGLAATCWDAELRAVVTLPVPPGIRFALLIPEVEASTATARAALPPSYTRADAVYNVGRTALLLAAWSRCRWDVLGGAMDDRLHQPYRTRVLFPWLERIFAAARGAGALGVALSGAGPSVLAIAREADAEVVARTMRVTLEAEGLAGQGWVLAADPAGARVEQISD